MEKFGYSVEAILGQENIRLPTRAPITLEEAE
ncbi:hypothetical protein PPTG_22784 [Phytophthora nicotianae INRA-310]|uniref:Uncharacterized protein n=1 Tax=Phytophthora nicotianae (strain INRA-310) TaxID=761204 RepID=W2QB08_PHYN3|nr:hypothetical protein PPTG_22784 [Phytophthora nicotianae INRA-310]ETN10051.1 hypothetical protein PPTG_22784 [Phytophthora nicotianae INRA-310]